jgi:hypothetical protein
VIEPSALTAAKALVSGVMVELGYTQAVNVKLVEKANVISIVVSIDFIICFTCVVLWVGTGTGAGTSVDVSLYLTLLKGVKH